MPDDNTIHVNNPTLLMYDGVGSSKAALGLPREQYLKEVLEPLYTKTQKLIEEHKGSQIGMPHGDDCLAAFNTAIDAVKCGIALQKQIPESSVTGPVGTEYDFKIRLVIHTARSQISPGDDYQNHSEVVYAARVLPLACANQILLTDSAKTAVGTPPFPCKEHRNRRIKNFEETPHSLHELLYDGVERDEPGSLFLPEWFREANRYIERPGLEAAISKLFAEKTTNGFPYRLITLWGFGGMGKSRLAYQCALQSAAIFADRIYLARLGDIATDSILNDEEARRDYLLFHILRAFKIPNDPPVMPEDLPDRVAGRLDNLKPTGPALLLLDNWETVRGKASARLVMTLLEACKELRILATGREKVNIDGYELPAPVSVLENEEANSLLIARVGEKKGNPDWKPTHDEQPFLNEILALTDRIPLAIQLVSAHAADTSLKNIVAGLKAEPMGPETALPEDVVNDPRTDRHESLERCLNLSWKLLKPEEQTALACLSLFADDCAADEVGVCFIEVPKHLKRLYNCSLANWNDKTDTYSLLRPTRAFSRERLKEIDTDEVLRRGFIAHYRTLAEENGAIANERNPAKRAVMERAWPHAQNAADIALALEDSESSAGIALSYGDFIDQQARWAELIPVLDRSLSALKQAFPTGHPSIAAGVNDLAYLYQSQGRYSEAELLYIESRAIWRAALPADHPLIATSLNNHAALYQSQGRYAEAEPLYLESLAIRRAALPEGHPDIAECLNNLAIQYYSQGRIAEAESLYLESLAILRSSLPASHPDIATNLNNLAELYRGQGRYAEAEPFYDEALKIDRAALPVDHPDIARDLNNLAVLYDNQGRYSVAEPLYDEALAMWRASLPEGHPLIATSLNNLAKLYYSLGRYSEAEPLYIEALAILRASLSEGHPDIATCLNNLAAMYYGQGRYSKAEQHHDEALAIRRAALPDGHPDIAGSLNNLAKLYCSLGHYAEAEPLYNEALNIRRAALPGGHPDIATTLHNLAELYRSQGRYVEAEPLYKEAVEIMIQNLGEDHPNTKTMNGNYELCLQMLNRSR